jgi:hypothetical protein
MYYMRESEAAIRKLLGKVSEPVVALAASERAAVVAEVTWRLSELETANNDLSDVGLLHRVHLSRRLRRLAVVLWLDSGPDGDIDSPA